MTTIKINCDEKTNSLLFPLWARAIEQQQSQPILIDPKSAEILTIIDYDFNKFFAANHLQVLCCLRSHILDCWVENYLTRYPQGVVIELGAGLSSRFERMNNGQVHWYELDMPNVIELRQQLYSESDRHQHLTASLPLVNWDWITQVKKVSNAPPLLLAEGVFMHLEQYQVKEILLQLASNFYGSMLLFDSISLLWIQNLIRYHQLNPALENVHFCWGINDIYELHDWDIRYQVLEVKTLQDIAKHYWHRFSLPSKIFCTLPLLATSYRLTKIGFGYGRTAQRLIKDSHEATQ